jgi:CHASE2 domain-containing sensor protein
MSNKWLRRIARGLGAFWGAFWVFGLVTSEISELSTGERLLSWESVGLAVLIAAEVAGVIVAWRKERVGGTMITITSLLLCIFAYFSAGHSQWFAVLVSGVPFLLSGILFLLVSRQKS